MKLILSLLLCSIITGALSQTITGSVVDAGTKVPLAYVNIGVVGKGIGTVSDINGKFSITLADSVNNSTLKFSYIGYKSRSFIVKNIHEEFKGNTLLIAMEENVFALSQVVVKPKVYKTKILGNRNNNKSMIAGFKSNDLGSELGTIMHANKFPVLIENLSFNIASNEIENAKFRVNIYSMKDGQPDSSLLQYPIYITTSLKSGTLSFDMKKYNLWANGDFFVSLEWIEDYGPDKLYFCVGIMDSNSMWRKTSQDKWQKASPVGIGFNSTVTYEK